MKYYSLKKFVVAIMIVMTFCSGIIRHDVNEEMYLNLAKEKQFDCVGQAFFDAKPIGSAVLISKRYVLSAAHVYSTVQIVRDTQITNGLIKTKDVWSERKVIDVSRLSFEFKDIRYKARRIILHPDYLKKATKGYPDLALIELEQDAKVEPAKTNQEDDELNSIVVGVGFGASGSADKPEQVGVYNKKIAGQNVIDKLINDPKTGQPTLLASDFDHPERADCNKLGSATPRPMEYMPTGGDSGGGLFRKKNGEWELIGITTGAGVEVRQLIKTGYYCQLMHWSRVSYYKNWINNIVK